MNYLKRLIFKMWTLQFLFKLCVISSAVMAADDKKSELKPYSDLIKPLLVFLESLILRGSEKQ